MAGISTPAALGALLALAGLCGVCFGLYVILRGGREGGEGLGPIPERGLHVLAGVRILLFGVITIAAGLYAVLRLG